MAFRDGNTDIDKHKKKEKLEWRRWIFCVLIMHKKTKGLGKLLSLIVPNRYH